MNTLSRNPLHRGDIRLADLSWMSRTFCRYMHVNAHVNVVSIRHALAFAAMDRRTANKWSKTV